MEKQDVFWFHLFIIFMRGRMRHRGVGSVTNRSGSEWPLCEFNFSYLCSCTELLIEHYVMYFSGFALNRSI